MPERVAPVQEISQVTSSILGESSETNRAENVIVESEIEAESNAIVVPEITQTPTAESTCDTPLTWPIEFGKNNNIDEVKILEKFLISQWEDLEIDGTYKQEDFEAVKRFQLKYKSEILDPWGVTEPTGFVFRTTVKKINEIACR